MALTDAECRAARPAAKLQKLTDGGGLQLWVQPSGARLWRLAYRFGGKQKLLALGVYPTISCRNLPHHHPRDLRIEPAHAVAANDKVRWVENVGLYEIQHGAVDLRPLRLH